tara:strand:- start:1316 stop:1852 length:537 start_codon:yes stop_codon:yes gene_type:complete
MNNLTGILIDPFNLTIEDFVIDHSGNEAYKKIQQAIECKTFSVTRLDETEVMFIDDEGRLKNHNRAFYLHNLVETFGHFNKELAATQLSVNILGHRETARMFTGKALILGDGGSGDAYDSQYSFEKLVNEKKSLYKLFVTDNDLEVGNIPYGVSFVETNRPEGFALHPHTDVIEMALV